MSTVIEASGVGLFDFPECTFTTTGLLMPEGMRFERWQALGQDLRKAAKGIQFWIGDWIRYGERHYGELYTQAIDATGRDAQTLMNYVYVAEHIEISRRRENVDFSTHAEVASLPPVEQDRILSKAESEDSSVRDVRKEVSRTKRRLGREKSEIELLGTGEVKDWLSELHQALIPFEESVPRDAGFLKVMIRSIIGVVEEQSERTVESDCEKIMSIFEADRETAPYSATDTEIYRWLIAHFYFIKPPEVDERLELLCKHKRLKYVQTGGRKEGQRGEMTWVYMPYGSKVFA